jgi:hydrogenase-4 membrane subunit HyfE
MTGDTIVKYLAAFILIASIFVLVLRGDVDASLYVTIVTSALAGLGIHAARNPSASAASDASVQPKEVKP